MEKPCQSWVPGELPEPDIDEKLPNKTYAEDPMPSLETPSGSEAEDHMETRSETEDHMPMTKEWFKKAWGKRMHRDMIQQMQNRAGSSQDEHVPEVPYMPDPRCEGPYEDPEEQAAVQRVRELLEIGCSVDAIQAELDEISKNPDERGSMWADSERERVLKERLEALGPGLFMV